MKYRYTRKELFKRLVNLAYVDSSDFKVDLFATKKAKKAKNSGGVKSGNKYDFVYGISADKIQPLNLAHTTTSRPELRQTEKEIMMENKVNEIIEYLNK